MCRSGDGVTIVIFRLSLRFALKDSMGNVSAAETSQDGDLSLQYVCLFYNFLRQSQIPTEIWFEILFKYAELVPKAIVKDERRVSVRDGDTRYFAPQFDRSSWQRLFRVHRIDFSVVSKDQGWSSYPQDQGTRTSNTWGTVAISTRPAESAEVYRNIHAGKGWEQQSATFDTSDQLVVKMNEELLRLGSRAIDSFEGYIVCLIFKNSLMPLPY